MKVLLINPPNRNLVTTNLPNFVDTERGFYPPLGILYVAAHAEQHTDYSIEILDTVVDELTDAGIRQEIIRRKPDIVGITTTTFTLIDSLNVAQIVKDIDPAIPVIFGGPHAHIFPEETIRLSAVDFVVRGEGEITFSELIQNIDEPERIKHIQGLVFEENNHIVDTGLREFNNHLDLLPFPARHLTPYKKYYSLIAKKNPITSMLTSRGCPYRCLYCHRPHMGRQFRARSPENVVEEMEICKEMGIQEILIYDDTFNVDKKRAIAICDLITQRGLSINFDIRGRIDRMDKDLLVALKKAGCVRVHYGIENANQRILDILQKGITVEQAERVIMETREAGIETLAYFMLGNPTETRSEVLNTIQFAKKIQPDYAHFAITTPFPATPLYNLGLEKGIVKDRWKIFAANPTKDFTPDLWEEELDRPELVELLQKSYKSFYLRPRFILKQFTKINSFEGFKRKVKAGMKLLVQS
jgi:anaerobic magnesium-protoporphyrin IX monomethyl ester cyclase